MITIEDLQELRESEDKVEFKAATHNFPYAGGEHRSQEDRRKCFLGYVAALANEKGGRLVLGMGDRHPHAVVGSDFAVGKVGKLTDDVYVRLGIRVMMQELFDVTGKRVLVVEVPSRPIGKTLKFEGVPLMRTGESLRNMSDEELFTILSEQEPDFSARMCPGLRVGDLDDSAIRKMKQAYADKQENAAFLSINTEQVLSDLGLLSESRLTYAALILLGRKDVIVQYLPQAQTIWEFRFTESQIPYDFRETTAEPLFVGIDKIWSLINGKNAQIPIRLGTRIFPIQSFNEEVIREAVLNAITHRDYSITSEVLIKQYPRKLILSNPGGFPKGVTLDNLITINSTPRSRLMAEVLEKTGFVERSGQGVDKIFSITLSEGKPEPDYTDSDNYQVRLKLAAVVEDTAFYVFLHEVQAARPEDSKLDVEHILALYKIKRGRFAAVKAATLNYLEREKLIKKTSGHTNRYVLADTYEEVASKEQRIGNRYLVTEVESILEALYGNPISIGELEKELEGFSNRNQIKYLLAKLYEDVVVEIVGRGKGTKYQLVEWLASLPVDKMKDALVNTLKEKYDGK